MKSYKHLYRSRENKAIAGVMGGFGEYLEIDPILLRAIYLGFSVFTALAPGILVYILMAIIIPLKPKVIHVKAEVKNEEDNTEKTTN